MHSEPNAKVNRVHVLQLKKQHRLEVNDSYLTQTGRYGDVKQPWDISGALIFSLSGSEKQILYTKKRSFGSSETAAKCTSSINKTLIFFCLLRLRD